MKHFLSLGAGVQSSTVLLLSCAGRLPKLDAAIFADTQWEPRAVYHWLDTVLEPAAAKAGIPLYRVTAGSVREGFLKAVTLPPGPIGQSIVSIPAYTRLPNGDAGILPRNCTRDYKISVIHRKIRELADGEPVTQWFGISGDELRRVRTSKVAYIRHDYPLIFGFDRPWHRHDCQRWLADNGFPPAPRSACLGCPFHDDPEWRGIKANPAEWADVVAFDAAIRDSSRHEAQLFLHADRQPLPLVDLESLEDKGQQNWLQEPLEERPQNWAEECEGLCGN